jgi:hypothetical protein
MVFTIEHQLPDWRPGFTSLLAMEVLDALARAYLPWRVFHHLPELYADDTRIVYRPDERHGSGVEVFRHPWEVLRRGRGDCNDLVLYRLVELYYAGKRPTLDHTRAEWEGGEIHVLVRLADGTLEDPSKMLLMIERLRNGNK